MKRRRATSTPARCDRSSSGVASLERDPVAPETAVATIATAGRSVVSDAEGLHRYPGGKNAPGIYQRIINQMPPHVVYIEPFLGSAAILRRKRFARQTVGIDIDPAIVARHAAFARRPECQILATDALKWLRGYFAGFVPPFPTLIYADPPYLGSARHWSARDCYTHEMKGETEHVELLRILTSCPAMVMINGYPSDLYEQHLKGWRRLEYQAQTRGGRKTEVLWMNFPCPTVLHDYGWLGKDYRERLRIARKIERWTSRLKAMPALERAAIVEALGVNAGGRRAS